MTARAMLLSEKTIREIAELAASPTCYSIGAQFARTLYEAERNRLMDEIELWREYVALVMGPLHMPTLDLSVRRVRRNDEPRRLLRIGDPMGLDWVRDYTTPIPLPEKHEEKGRDHE